MFIEKSLVKIFQSYGIESYSNYSLKEKNTYKTGGDAKCIIFPDTAEKVKSALKILNENEITFEVLGRGSNFLVSDEGFDGVILSTEKLKGISVKGKIVTCLAGETVADFLKIALYSSLGGVEFLSGIPASVGGVVTMNAGCFGKNTGDYVSYVLSASGIYNRENCGFDYRTSRFKEEKDCVILVAFDLENVEYEQSESKINYFLKLRRAKQPKGRSCGSVFKNDGFVAGKIIDSCNLKGFRVGGARVSEKHANFIIADSNAKSSDISRLIRYIKRVVYEKHGVILQEELEYLGKFDDENQS